MGMATMLSPGVTVREFDFSETVPQTSISNGALVGGFQWGPVDEITLVSAESRLVRMFGKPDTNSFKWWYTAKNFLDYSRNLRVVRVVDSTAVNADTGTGTLIKNEEDWQLKWDGGTALSGIDFIAKYPGKIGNNLRVLMADYSVYTALDESTVVVTAPGSSYVGTETVTISAPDDAGGVQATATITQLGGALTGIVLTEAGSGYTKAPTVTINDETGSGATVTIGIWSYASSFLSAPADSNSVTNAGGSGDGLHCRSLCRAASIFLPGVRSS